MNFTAEQLKAIQSRGSNILVSAGAGSGKTGVLTERIVDRLRQGEDIDKLLVLTYTKAASSEMLTRVRKKIFEELSTAKTKEERRHWQRQIVLLGDAPITTMHSFCMQLVRRHYNAFPGLDPEFRIMEPSMAKVHLLDLLNHYFETCYTNENMEERQKFFSLVRLYGSRLKDDGLKEEMIHLREFGYAQGNLYDWLKEAVTIFCDLDFWHEKTLEITKKEAIVILDSLKNGVAVIRRCGGPAGYDKVLSQEIESLQYLLANWTWDAIQNTTVFQRLSGKKKDDNEELVAYIKKLHESAKKYYSTNIEDFFYRDFKDYAREITIISEDMKTLTTMTAAFSQIYQDYKTKKGFMEFSDLEQYAYDLLRNHPELAKEYQEGFHEVLIDEYQDVNPLQEKILTLLSNGNNLFVVGDIKQSIYGFRFADHSIFKARYDRYGKDIPNENGLKILLNKNFRSKEGILESVNFFFRQWMNESVSHLSYGEEEELTVGNEAAQSSKSTEDTEIQYIYTPGEEERSIFYDDPDAVHLHGRYIANRIEEMMSSGETICDNGVERKLRYSDFAILLRSVKGEAPLIEEELTYRSIPVTGPNQRSFTQGQEVRLFISILAMIDNPCQDIPLAAVMRSPFFGFDENQMMAVALCDRSEKLWHRISGFLQLSDDEALKKKVKTFADTVADWRYCSLIYSIGDLIQKIMDDTGYLSFWSGLPGSKNRIANIKIFKEKAVVFQENGGGLFDFLRYLKNLQDANADVVDDSMEDSNSVRILSIHKSKGLEYPIVFCASVNKKFNTRDFSSPLLLDSDLGLGPKYKDFSRHTVSSTLPSLLIKHKKAGEERAEHFRILYVAMTRAKNKLIFTATIKKKEDREKLMERAAYYQEVKLPAEILASGSSFLHWICYGMARKDNESISLPHDDVAIATSLIPGSNPLEQISLDKKNAFLNKKALERLQSTLNYEASVDVPGKVTVTELLPQTEMKKQDITMRNPRFLEDAPKVTAAEAGTAFHRLMEHLDFKKVWNINLLKAEIKTLTTKGYFIEKEALSIDVEAVLFFLESPYGLDLRTATKIKNELAFTAAFSAKELLGLDTQEKTMLQGAVDMVYCRENGEWVLMDFKTNQLTSKGEADFLHHYEKQLNLYAMALKHLYGIDFSEKVFYLTKERRFLSNKS